MSKPKNTSALIGKLIAPHAEIRTAPVKKIAIKAANALLYTGGGALGGGLLGYGLSKLLGGEEPWSDAAIGAMLGGGTGYIANLALTTPPRMDPKNLGGVTDNVSHNDTLDKKYRQAAKEIAVGYRADNPELEFMQSLDDKDMNRKIPVVTSDKYLNPNEGGMYLRDIFGRDLIQVPPGLPKSLRESLLRHETTHGTQPGDENPDPRLDSLRTTATGRYFTSPAEIEAYLQELKYNYWEDTGKVHSDALSAKDVFDEGFKAYDKFSKKPSYSAGRQPSVLIQWLLGLSPEDRAKFIDVNTPLIPGLVQNSTPAQIAIKAARELLKQYADPVIPESGWPGDWDQHFYDMGFRDLQDDGYGNILMTDSNGNEVVFDHDQNVLVPLGDFYGKDMTRDKRIAEPTMDPPRNPVAPAKSAAEKAARELLKRGSSMGAVDPQKADTPMFSPLPELPEPLDAPNTTTKTPAQEQSPIVNPKGRKGLRSTLPTTSPFNGVATSAATSLLGGPK